MITCCKGERAARTRRTREKASTSSRKGSKNGWKASSLYSGMNLAMFMDSTPSSTSVLIRVFSCGCPRAFRVSPHHPPAEEPQETNRPVAEVIALCKVAAVLRLALLLRGEVEEALANVILPLYFLFREARIDETEEPGGVNLGHATNSVSRSYQILAVTHTASRSSSASSPFPPGLSNLLRSSTLMSAQGSSCVVFCGLCHVGSESVAADGILRAGVLAGGKVTEQGVRYRVAAVQPGALNIKHPVRGSRPLSAPSTPSHPWNC